MIRTTLFYKYLISFNYKTPYIRIVTLLFERGFWEDERGNFEVSGNARWYRLGSKVRQ